MEPITTLPENYVERRTLDLSKDLGLMMRLQFFGTIALLLTGWVFWRITYALRPDANQVLSLQAFTQRGPDGSFTITLPILFLVSLAAATVLLVVFHEAVHGLFFWLFTGRRPRFGFKGLYAYAASPVGVYIPRNQYLMVGAAPLVILTLVGVLLIPIIPLIALPALFIFLISNTAGSVGDLFVVGWLLREPPQVVLIDSGDAMTSFGPESL